MSADNAQSLPVLKRALIDMAMEIGFDAVKIVDADSLSEEKSDMARRLREFVRKGLHGDMAWMEKNIDRRENPRTLWPEVNSIIVLGMNYGPDKNPLDMLKQKTKGNISVYAQRRDYHDIIKKKLKQLARWLLAQEAAGQADVKVFVDTAPVMEKPIAHAAGLGWQGKHTNLVSREFGSWLFLGSIFTTLHLPADAPEDDYCGTCRACLDICPTNAFIAPYKLDASRCISYLTIESKEQTPLAYREAIGNRIFGCDDCLAVCPWNKYAATAREAKLQQQEELHAPDLIELSALDDTAFREFFAGTPVKRTGRDRFVRNVLIAMGNADDASMRPAIEERLHDMAALVRGMAVWALSNYASAEEMQNRAEAALVTESDAEVRAEWERYL